MASILSQPQWVKNSVATFYGENAIEEPEPDKKNGTLTNQNFYMNYPSLCSEYQWNMNKQNFW